jgi:hypothetical protein
MGPELGRLGLAGCCDKRHDLCDASFFASGRARKGEGPAQRRRREHWRHHPPEQVDSEDTRHAMKYWRSSATRFKREAQIHPEALRLADGRPAPLSEQGRCADFVDMGHPVAAPSSAETRTLLASLVQDNGSQATLSSSPSSRDPILALLAQRAAHQSIFYTMSDTWASVQPRQRSATLCASSWLSSPPLAQTTSLYLLHRGAPSLYG